jgi:hypothetical protein
MSCPKAELLEHRALVTSEMPSLPQRAGRALAKLRVYVELLTERRSSSYEVDEPTT